jgi:hypothetical protein
MAFPEVLTKSSQSLNIDRGGRGGRERGHGKGRWRGLGSTYIHPEERGSHRGVARITGAIGATTLTGLEIDEEVAGGTTQQILKDFTGEQHGAQARGTKARTMKTTSDHAKEETSKAGGDKAGTTPVLSSTIASIEQTTAEGGKPLKTVAEGEGIKESESKRGGIMEKHKAAVALALLVAPPGSIASSIPIRMGMNRKTATKRPPSVTDRQGALNEQSSSILIVMRRYPWCQMQWMRKAKR